MQHVSAQFPPPPDEIILDFAHRLRDAVKVASRERGEALVAAIISQVQRDAKSRAGKRANRELRKQVAGLTRQFFRAVEETFRTRVREALGRERASRAKAAEHSSVHTGQAGLVRPAPTRRRGRRPALRPLTPPRDPEQIKRDAEFARLRALLRPAAEEPPAPAPAPVTITPIPQPQRPATPGEFLRALEKEIQNAVPFLGNLGPQRCGAQIAVWAGQVRELRDRLDPELSAAMRPALRIFLEHLTELRAAMDAHFVDALEPKWSPPDWGDYVEVNRARLESRPPAIAAEKIAMHHRAMLRALVLPHRRNVPGQAVPVINAAAEALGAEDSLLRSAIRRHRAERRAEAEPETESPPPPVLEQPVVEQDAATLVAEPSSASPEPTSDDAPTPTPESAAPEPEPATTPESEFEQTWTK